MAKKTYRLIPRVPVSDMDSVKVRHRKIGEERDMHLLQRCETLWNNLDEYRRENKRSHEFTYGDQWAEKITVNGKTMTQREYLISQGNVALQTNQIRKIVDTITGVMIKEKNEPVCNARDRDEQQYGELMTTTLQANCNKNQMETLFVRFMRNVLIGGLAVAEECYETREGRTDSWTDLVDPDSFFFDQDGEDPRFWDLSLLGRIVDLSPDKLLEKFGFDQNMVSFLMDLYHDQFHVLATNDDYNFNMRHRYNYSTFLEPVDRAKCRVFEVWTRESKARYRLYDYNEGSVEIIDATDSKALSDVDDTNASRMEAALAAGWDPETVPLIEKEFFIDTYWYCRFLAPDGTIIWECESPYAGREHPFSICATPMAEGRIVGYIHDAIDHNIAINRAIVLQDWLIRSQAKGVTMVPTSVVPDDMSPQEFADQWTSIDGMIFYTPKKGENFKPEVFHGASQTFDAARLIEQYTKLMEESTAVSGAIQGKTPYAGTSGSLYAQQAANSSTPIASIMTQFRLFMEQIAVKKMKNIAQHYGPDRYKSIAGNIDSLFNNPNLNLNEVGNIEYDLSIKESTETPVYRMMANDTLMQLLQAQAVTGDEVLKYGYFPFADKLLQAREAREAEMNAAQQGQPPLPETFNPAMMQQADQQQTTQIPAQI